jgi:hypothetical protein
MNIDQISKTAHAVHRAYCFEMGIPTQPKWVEVSPEHKAVVANTVRNILLGNITSIEESHNLFVESKVMDGWSFDKEYSLENKTNPRLVPFNLLSKEQRVKEALFFKCVSSFTV